MINILNALEFRSFKPDEVIYNEMDESLEILFVYQGKYDVGYEINKKAFYRRQFGPSTIIGGFEICYGRRFNFIYKAHTPLQCLAIRKMHYFRICEEFPQLHIQMKLKFWEHFSQAVY